MSPGKIEPPVSWSTEVNKPVPEHKGQPRNIATIDAIHFDENLQPKHYDILCTHPESRVLFTDVNIIDSTGRAPYRGDVFIEGQLLHIIFSLASI
jgi:hypothetical protein